MLGLLSLGCQSGLLVDLSLIEVLHSFLLNLKYLIHIVFLLEVTLFSFLLLFFDMSLAFDLNQPCLLIL